MSEPDIQIDEHAHKCVPTTAERLKHSLIAVGLGFLLINIIGFWMFPGIGVGGFYLISSTHSLASVVGEMTNILILTILAICAVYGWFRGRHFTDQLKSYIEAWRFW